MTGVQTCALPICDRAERRQAIATQLASWWFERRRLLVLERLQPRAEVEPAVTRRLRIAELEADIDALTGGLLSASLVRDRANELQPR